MTSDSKAVCPCAMLLAFRSLEEVYVRGRTVHFVGSGHRFYGNIECESVSDLQVGPLAPLEESVLGSDQEWGFQLDLTLDEDMARSGRERVRFHFADREQATMVHQVFIDVAASMRGAAS